jgi:hypothetical protein
MESSAAKGEWTVPAFQEVTLGLALTDFSASWRGIRGQHSEHIGAGTVAICELDRPKTFAMQSEQTLRSSYCAEMPWSRSDKRLDS